MTHFPDEVPDVDEQESNWLDVEEKFCPDLCPRCGGKHKDEDCETVTWDLLRNLPRTYTKE